MSMGGVLRLKGTLECSYYLRGGETPGSLSASLKTAIGLIRFLESEPQGAGSLAVFERNLPGIGIAGVGFFAIF